MGGGGDGSVGAQCARRCGERRGGAGLALYHAVTVGTAGEKGWVGGGGGGRRCGRKNNQRSARQRGTREAAAQRERVPRAASAAGGGRREFWLDSRLRLGLGVGHNLLLDVARDDFIFFELQRQAGRGGGLGGGRVWEGEEHCWLACSV